MHLGQAELGLDMSKSETTIVALESKAGVLRRIACDLDFRYTEGTVPGETGVIRFTFELTEEESLRLLRMVPRDVYARRAFLL